jgi:gliding motility-associated-like protein
VFPIPDAAFTPTPNPASVLDPNVTMVNQSSPDVAFWYWNFGDGDTLSPLTPSPTHAFPSASPGVYTTTLIVASLNGCVDTTSRTIEIGPEFTFYIPNAFSPNGDGVNDEFFGKGIGINKFELYIFDRWGNMIFYADDINKHWDGRANRGAEMAQQDVYVWKVRLTDVFDRRHNYIGTVTIVK